eukprot:scaffold18711_cov119-Isochrysis_galbana.AAC.4
MPSEGTEANSASASHSHSAQHTQRHKHSSKEQGDTNGKQRRRGEHTQQTTNLSPVRPHRLKRYVAPVGRVQCRRST